MRIASLAVALFSLVTVPQHDQTRSSLDAPSVSVSSDGRYVAFLSYARLAPADTNDGRDVYVLDRGERSVVLESLALAAVPAGNSDHPALSSDGRLLVYETQGRIVWRDRIEGTAAVVGAGHQPSISGDGRFVVFTSDEGIARFEVLTQTIRLVSVDSAGRSIPGVSTGPSVSGDGRYVAFATTAALTPVIIGANPRDENRRRSSISHVYVRDMQEGVTRLVSTGMGQKPADGNSWGPVISTDGRTVAFVSAAANLVSEDRNRAADVFMADVATGSIDLVSRSLKGGSGHGASASPAVSSDGRFVVFQSEASDLAKFDEDINLLWDVFLFDRQRREIVRLSTDPDNPWMEASGGPAIDGSGNVIAFSSRHPIDPSDKLNDFDLFVLTRK